MHIHADADADRGFTPSLFGFSEASPGGAPGGEIYQPCLPIMAGTVKVTSPFLQLTLRRGHIPMVTRSGSPPYSGGWRSFQYLEALLSDA